MPTLEGSTSVVRSVLLVPIRLLPCKQNWKIAYINPMHKFIVTPTVQGWASACLHHPPRKLPMEGWWMSSRAKVHTALTQDLPAGPPQFASPSAKTLAPQYSWKALSTSPGIQALQGLQSSSLDLGNARFLGSAHLCLPRIQKQGKVRMYSLLVRW